MWIPGRIAWIPEIRRVAARQPKVRPSHIRAWYLDVAVCTSGNARSELDSKRPNELPTPGIFSATRNWVEKGFRHTRRARDTIAAEAFIMQSLMIAAAARQGEHSYLEGCARDAAHQSKDLYHVSKGRTKT